MKNKIWMPLYIGDYLAETAHLNTIQHGAYLLLIMHYWRKQGLPKTDQQLAHVARLTTRGWLNIKPIIAPLFNNDWSHDQLDQQITRQAEIAAMNALKGAKGGNRAAMNRDILATRDTSKSRNGRSPNPDNLLKLQLSAEAMARIGSSKTKSKQE